MYRSSRAKSSTKYQSIAVPICFKLDLPWPPLDADPKQSNRQTPTRSVPEINRETVIMEHVLSVKQEAEAQDRRIEVDF